MGVLPGVYRTRVGYTGGEKKFPTYRSLGNHTEALEIDFDPRQIAFADIVELFWKTHDPLRGVRSRQYMTAIWYRDAGQREVIEEAKDLIESRLAAAVQTPILPLDVFYLAEDYHQKYCLQQSPLMSRFHVMYPKFEGFNNSTAAARLNGLVAGNGNRQLFDAERDGYGFSAEELAPLASSLPSLSAARCSGDSCSLG